MSSLPPDDPLEMLGWLANEKAEENRRNRNRKREGRIFAAKPEEGLYRVRFREAEGDEPAFDSPWLPVQATSAGGVRTMIEPTIGQWVTVISESGELVDGVIVMSAYYDDRPRPHNKNGEIATDVSDGAYRSIIDQDGAETTKATARTHNTDGDETHTVGGSVTHDTGGNIDFNTSGVVRFN